MDHDQLNDPLVTPSKSLRNVRLSPKSNASRKNIESSPIEAFRKTEDLKEDLGA